MPVEKEDMALLVNVVKQVSDYDFSDYSERSLNRRIDKILIDNKVNIHQLIQKLRTNTEFVEKFVRDITVNTTELFRDPKAWQTIRFRVLNKFQDQRTINIWHAGCSTGQEVYSMLILLNEMNLFDKANVFATDINTDVLDVARKGEYKYRFNINYLDNYSKVIEENPYNYDEFNHVPYNKYFDVDKTKDTYRMKSFLTRKPLFKKHNLVKEGNVFYTKFDLILCRNVLIYFNSQLQNFVFELFHESLFSKGCLILGAHESMSGPVASKFLKKGIIYIKK